MVEPTLHPVIPVATGGMTVTDWKALKAALEESSKPLFVTGRQRLDPGRRQRADPWLEEHHLPAAVEWRCEGNIPFSSPSYVGPIGYGRPKPTYDLLEETDLLVFVGTVPGDVITDGFLVRQDWTKKNFLVTIDPRCAAAPARSPTRSSSKPDVFVRDLVMMDFAGKPEWKSFTDRMRAEQEKFAALPAGRRRPRAPPAWTP